MLGNVTIGKGIARTVWYHEKKVEKGMARLLMARNFEERCQTVKDRITFLESRAALNKRVTKPCFHVSLSWPTGVQLENDRLPLIADTYMNRLGLGHQPYLVYEHLDTANPHIHILTVKVGENGHNLGNTPPTLFHYLHLEMEKEFGLTTDRRLTYNRNSYEYHGTPPLFLEERASPPLKYGKETSTEGVARTLEKILGTYQFTSLEEFNAILYPYLLRAERGRPGSRIYEHRGLVYRPIEPKPKPHYLKASLIPGKPTLPYLEARFEQNKPNQEQAARRVRNLMDLCLTGLPNHPLARLKKRLEGEGIHLHWTIPKKEGTPTIVYIDHKERWAFDETVLGEDYTAQSLMKRFDIEKKDLKESLEHSLTQQRNTHGRELNL